MDGFPRNFDGKKYGPYRNQKCTYLGGSSEKKKIMGKTKKKSGKKKRRFFACDRQNFGGKKILNREFGDWDQRWGLAETTCHGEY